MDMTDNVGLIVDFCVINDNGQLVGEGDGVVITVDDPNEKEDGNDDNTMTQLELAKI